MFLKHMDDHFIYKCLYEVDSFTAFAVILKIYTIIFFFQFIPVTHNFVPIINTYE